jgi:hypothetical protein
MLNKKIWANLQRIIELFTQKIVTKLSKLWVWDPRSGIRKKAPDPGSAAIYYVDLFDSLLYTCRREATCLNARHTSPAPGTGFEG